VLGVAYVFGMVFPLFTIALLWDKFNWGESRLLRGRRLSFRALGRQLSVHTTALASGLILVAMGIVVIFIAFQGNSMPSSGWQLELSARLQHYAHLVKVWADALPGWITGVAHLRRPGGAPLGRSQASRPATPARRDASPARAEP